MKNKRKIVISLISTVIVGYGIICSDKDTSNSNTTSSLPQSNHFEYTSPHRHSLPQGTSELNRDRVLTESVKGYREQTYWGNEHPIDQWTEDFSDKEFSDFIENDVKSKDIDIYLGAEY